jgi:uncharacterized SAM-binding protein YcdF (DUF218 family)
MMRMPLRQKLLTAAILCLILAWGTGLVWFTTLIPDTPAKDDLNTDAIVVLTGGGLRLERGFELLAQGRAPRMFISGVEDGLTVAMLLNKKEYHDFAGKIPPNSVILGHKARSTTGNALEIAEWVKAENVKTIRLVSGNYHIPRSMHEIKQAVPELTIIAEPVFPRHFEENRWWDSWTGIRLVVSEYSKYVVSFLIAK